MGMLCGYKVIRIMSQPINIPGRKVPSFQGASDEASQLLCVVLAQTHWEPLCLRRVTSLLVQYLFTTLPSPPALFLETLLRGPEEHRDYDGPGRENPGNNVKAPSSLCDAETGRQKHREQITVFVGRQVEWRSSWQVKQARRKETDSWSLLCRIQSVLFDFALRLYFFLQGCVYMRGSQRTICRSRLSPSTVWVPGVKLRLSGSATSAFTQ